MRAYFRYKVLTMSVWISLVLVLAASILQFVDGHLDVCDHALSTGNEEYRRGGLHQKLCDDMMVIAHGKKHNTKCKYLDSMLYRYGLQGDCGDILQSTCPVSPPYNHSHFHPYSHPPSAYVIPTDCPTELPECDSSYRYRSIDGSCNNLLNPRWGKAGSQQRRFFRNAYDDGKGSPKSKNCFGGMLPSPRTVSNIVHSTGPLNKYEPDLTLLVMKVGQFIAHDIILTEIFTKDDGKPYMCCGKDRHNPHCYPIKIPEDDPYFSECMSFVRSNASLDCNSVRQQINSQTSYLDLSVIYGKYEEHSSELRLYIGGKLKNVQTKLPIDYTDSTCILSKSFHPVHYYCPMSGDVRVNEQPGLSAVHTLFMREHNRLADGLSVINPHWDDERLFQEARKINIGQWQNILYSEYLTVILGRDTSGMYGLDVPRYGYNENYDPNTDATVSNAFGAAVFRHGHSQVHDLIGLLTFSNQMVTEPLEKHFMEPDWYHTRNGNGLEHIINWATATRCPLTDRKIQGSVRNNLFLDAMRRSFDLASFNIQRGREHGLPGYTAFRTLCELSDVQHFGTGPGGLVDHDIESANLLQSVYACPSDIDLWTGLLTERRHRESILGPTWNCLIAKQFKSLRNGDRFFFERKDILNPEIGFTEPQLNSIKSITMSNIICQNTQARVMQNNAFRKPYDHGNSNNGNPVRRCDSFSGVDLHLWKEFPL